MVLEARVRKKKVYLSSLGPDLFITVGLVARYRLDSDEELIDQDLHQQMRSRHVYPTIPIDPSIVAKAQTGEEPLPGRDCRAVSRKPSTCPECKHYRARDGWEHSRENDQRSYPYDDPKIPECEACQRREHRLADGHSYEAGKCRYSLDAKAAAVRVRHSTGG